MSIINIFTSIDDRTLLNCLLLWDVQQFQTLRAYKMYLIPLNDLEYGRSTDHTNQCFKRYSDSWDQ